MDSRGVPVFVMEFHDREIGLEAGRALQNPAPDCRVLLNEREFLACQLAGFLQYGVGDTDLADIVEQGADP